MRRKLGDFLLSFAHIAPEHQVAAIREWLEIRGFFRIDEIAVALQLQILDDALLQEAIEVCGAGDFITGEAFFGDARAANDVATFEYENFQSGASQVAGGDQAVMP